MKRVLNEPVQKYHSKFIASSSFLMSPFDVNFHWMNLVEIQHIYAVRKKLSDLSIEDLSFGFSPIKLFHLFKFWFYVSSYSIGHER